MSSFFALGENICRHRCAFNPLEARSLRDGRCLIMLSSMPRRLSSDVLLAADPAATRASARLLQPLTHRASVFWRGFILSKSAQVSAKFTVQHSEHVRMFQASGECCTLGSKGTSHNSSYLTRVPSTETVEGLTAQDVRMRRHDHVTTRG